MKRIKHIALSFLLVAFVGAGAAHAQAKGSIELRMLAEQEIEVINAEGLKEIKRIEAARVVPGNEVIYTIHYMNAGKEPADSVVITNPIPDHMMYKDGSASGEDAIVTFSVDSGKTFDLPQNLKVLDSEGKEKPAAASDYTHVRWTLLASLSPQTGGYVSFRAILE